MPYFSKENLEDCLKQTLEIKKLMSDYPKKFAIQELPENKKYNMEDFCSFFCASFLGFVMSSKPFKGANNILPPVMYCFEMLYFCIFIKTINQKGFFQIDKNSYIPLCKLVPDIKSIDYALFEEEIRLNKYKAIKIKVGRHEISDEINAIKKLAHIIKKSKKEDVSIRLDPNMAFSKSEAIKIFKKISGLHAELIEDPVKDTSFYQELYKKTGINIETDETLKDFIDLQKISFWQDAGSFLKAL